MGKLSFSAASNTGQQNVVLVYLHKRTIKKGFCFEVVTLNFAAV